MATSNKSNSKNDPKKVADVSKPGDFTPNDSARPVIVGHKVLSKDPMVAETPSEVEDKASDTKPGAPTVSKIGVTITPPSEKAPAADKAKKPVEPAKKEPAVEEKPPAEEPAPEEPSQTETAESDTEKKEPEASDAGAVSAVAEQAGAKKDAKKLSQADQAQAEKIQQLIKSKQYNVDIKQGIHTRSGSRLGLVLVLLLVVAAAGFYLAIDANLVDVGIDVPYHLLGE